MRVAGCEVRDARCGLRVAGYGVRVTDFSGIRQPVTKSSSESFIGH
ncbi:MAG: hypothetical protein JRE36_08550 [Deltaproteobacteria bacterium]|nr:hypothetical protein [Deltaproteobacteria bacterium]